VNAEVPALLAFAVVFWWVIDGPGSASWRAGFGLVVTDPPRQYRLEPIAESLRRIPK
jgi:hypothetical protein